MSVMKYAFAPVQEPVLDQRHWALMHGERGRQAAAKFAGVSKTAGTKCLLSHVTIMASVACEPDPTSWLIKPESASMVNRNGDAWANEVLLMSYPTFRGSFNFVEHYQNSKASKGWIVDAVARKVFMTPDVYVYYIDLLVATDLRHEELVEKIRSGEVRFLSMGCLAARITCSICGAHNDGSEPACFHLTAIGKARKFYTDGDGIARIVAELCGSTDLPGGGVTFVEASWVKTPAFPGAERRNIILDGWDLPDSFTAKKSASLLTDPGQIAKAASLLATSTDQLSPSHIEPRVLAELRRLQ